MKSPEDPYTTSGHLTENQLLRYQAEAMDGAEMNRVERHLLECELCSDALDGISMLETKKASAAVADIKSRLGSRLEEQKAAPAVANWRWAAAAGVLLLVAASVYLIFNRTASINQQLAQQEVLEENTVAAPPQKQGADTTAFPQITPPPLAEEPLGQTTTSAAPLLREEKPAPPLLAQEDADNEQQTTDNGSRAAPSVTEALSGRAAGVQVQDEIELADLSWEEDSPAPAPAQKSESALSETEITQSTPRALSKSARSITTDNQRAATREIRGKVTESGSGEPIPGASIRIKGSDRGTVTDVDGEYTLVVPAAETMLSINFIGYREESVLVSPTNNNIVAELEPDVESLSEVVVTGYDTRTRPAGATEPAETTTPRPAAGMWNFRKWIKENQRYPAAALEAGAEGVVVVAFFVETDGSLSQFQIKKSAGYGLDEEAIRLLKEGPAWQPATVNKEPVRQEEIVRIPFKLPKH
ncbi:tonb family protein [Flammeovirgaceae bacterium 311]|nr:tonb family protein [Flammeovirgaceae bacterium 311]